MASKANLLKKAKSEGIPTFGNPTVAELEHRLSKWRSGPGWVVRRLHQKALPTWAGNIPAGETLWLPNCGFAHRLMRTGRIVLLGRMDSPPDGAFVVDTTQLQSEEEE